MDNKKYISVEDAIKTTWMILDGLGYAFDENPQLKKTVPAVFDTAPTADVRPVVRGHIEEDENTYLFCSECNCNITLVAYETPDNKLVLRPNFCPNCGADMREES